MLDTEIKFIVPDHWVFRQIEPDGELVMAPRDNPGNAQFRPNAVIVSAAMNGQSVDQVLETAFAELTKVLRSLRREPVVPVSNDARYLRADYRYQLDGLDLEVMQFVLVAEGHCITTTCTSAADDIDVMRATFEAIGRSVRLTGRRDHSAPVPAPPKAMP